MKEIKDQKGILPLTRKKGTLNKDASCKPYSLVSLL